MFNRKKLDKLQKHITRLEQKLDALLLAQSAQLITNQRKEKGKISVLFIIHNMYTWSALALIYQQLIKRADTSVHVLGITSQNSEYDVQNTISEKVTEFLSLAGIPFSTIDEKDINQFMALLNAINPDWIIRQSPWDKDLPEIFSSLHLSHFKLAYVPYMGIDLVKDFSLNNINQEVNQNFHLYCDRIYCQSEIAFKQHQELYLGDKGILRFLGSPKLEYILDYFSNKPKKERDKTFNLLWTPHHSIEKNTWLQFATFQDNCLLFIELAKRLGDKIHIRLRPHPILFIKMKKTNPRLFTRFIREWEKLSNTSIDDYWDQIPSFEWSDALITDGVSFLAEYPLTNKPSIFIKRKEHLEFNENGLLAENCSHIATSHQDIEELITQLVDNKLPVKTAEIEKFKTKLSIEGASTRIVQDLLG